MKVAFIPSTFLPWIGGAEIQTHNTANKLVEQGNTVDVFLLNKQNIKNKQLISTQIADYMEFINIINYNNQIEEAFNQMIIIIFNNKWILNMEFIKLKIKNCLIKYFNKVEISEYYYMVLFLIDSRILKAPNPTVSPVYSGDSKETET